MSRFVGVIGIFLILAGFRLLWQARGGFYYWMERYTRLFARLLREPEAKHQASMLAPQQGESHTLRLVIGTFLVFLVGPVLVFLGLIVTP